MSSAENFTQYAKVVVSHLAWTKKIPRYSSYLEL